MLLEIILKLVIVSASAPTPNTRHHKLVDCADIVSHCLVYMITILFNFARAPVPWRLHKHTHTWLSSSCCQFHVLYRHRKIFSDFVNSLRASSNEFSNRNRLRRWATVTASASDTSENCKNHSINWPQRIWFAVSSRSVTSHYEPVHELCEACVFMFSVKFICANGQMDISFDWCVCSGRVTWKSIKSHQFEWTWRRMAVKRCWTMPIVWWYCVWCVSISPPPTPIRLEGVNWQTVHSSFAIDSHRHPFRYW